MKITIQSPEYLPGLDYFRQLFSADVTIFLDSIKLPKRDPVSRTSIFVKEGPESLIIPILRSGRFGQTIMDAEINYKEDWIANHTRRLYHAYKDMPYFEAYYYDIFDELQKKPAFVADLNINLIEMIMKKMRVEFRFDRTGRMELTGSGEDLLIDAARKIGADQILLPAYAEEFLNSDSFEQHDIGVNFYAETKNPSVEESGYRQTSIFDLLCRNDRIKVLEILNGT